MPTPAPPTPWISKKARPAARLRLFCFPFSGGGASAFRGWADALPTVEVCAVQPPGRESRLREPAFTRMDPLVAALTEAVRPHLEGPFAFFGHSLGAYVALEVARALRREGAPLPLHLFVSASPAPEALVIERPIHALPDRELREELRRYQGTPEEILRNDELMALLLPVVRADFAIYESYRAAAEPPLDVPISAFVGLDDDRAPREQMEGWRAHSSREFSLRVFPGHHFFIHDERPRVLSALRTDLEPLLY
jgi:surfactin synthase thioesterase subunit